MTASTAAPADTISGTVTAFLQDTDGAGLTMRERTDRIQDIVRAHPTAITVRFAPNTRPGAGLIEALDADETVITTVRITNRGEVRITDAETDAASDQPAPATGETAPVEAPQNDRLQAALHSLLGSDETQTAPPEQPQAIGALLTGLPRVGQRIVSQLLQDGGITDDTPATPQQTERAGNVPAGLSRKAAATYVLDGARIEQQVSDATTQRKATTAGRKSQATPRKPRKSKYSDEVRAAVRLTDDMLGKAGPHAKHHSIIRAYVQRVTQGPVTPERLLELAGGVNVKALRDLATRTGDIDKQKATLKTLKPLGKSIDHAFCAGRGLAAVLVVWHKQLTAAAKDSE